MGNSSKKPITALQQNQINQDETELEEHSTSIWSPAYNEFRFGDSPDDVNKKLPQEFSTIQWDTLPIAYEYQLDMVRYFFIRINEFSDETKFIPPHEYVSSSSFVCFMFTKLKLFRISVRLLHDDRAKNYRSIVKAYARSVNQPLLKDGMFHYEDERIFFYSNEQDDHTVIETIEKGNVIADGNIWNPHPTNQLPSSSSALSSSKYSYDIMISYSHQDKELVHKIYSKLLEDGFKIWMDLENMYGSTLDRMAEAIQNSQFILICASNRYQTSPYCKTEGQYTYKLQKSFIPIIVEKGYRPHDWLGALLGLRMYVDFTKYSFEQAYQLLLKEIRKNKSEQ